VNKVEDFEVKGLYIETSFINSKLLKELNSELDYYFQEYSFNGSIRCQRYAPDTKIFDYVHFLESINFYELMLDLVDKWKFLYPKFEEEQYVLTRASFKDEIDGDSILWHTDITPELFRNIIYLDGGLKDSGQLRFMIGSHKMNHDIEFAMTKDDFEKYQELVVDCEAPLGSAIFFDAKGFHSNYPRIKNRRALLLAWEKRKFINAASRLQLASSNLSKRVIDNIHFFALPEYKYFKEKDYDFNPPRPIEPKAVFKYLLHSMNIYFVIAFKIKVVNLFRWILGKQNKYNGSFLVKKKSSQEVYK
jgi:hypothetical protein